jgi:gas vesicle protein
MGQAADELRADIERRRENMSGTVDAIEDRVRPGRIIERRRQAMRRSVGRARDRVMGTRDDLGGRVSEAADAATSRVRDVGSEITDMPELVADQTRGAPIIAGSIAFGIGALLALVLPETEAEQRVADKVQPQLAAATDAAKEAGRQALETAQEVSKDAIDDLKESATEHASEIAQQAKGASEQVKETAKDAAGS